MLWIALSFSGPVLWAVSTHIDKYLVERFFKDSGVGTLLIFTALIGLVPMPIICALAPQDVAAGPEAIAVIAFSGLLYMGAMYFYLEALQREEASVIAPLFQTAPIFVYALAYFGLGEKLSWTQLGGGALILGSAGLLSFEPSEGRARFKTRTALLMLACAFALALSSVIFKYFAVKTSFWGVTFWTFAGEAVFAPIMLAVPYFRREFFRMFQKHPGAVVSINGANELINLGGGLAARYASLLGPVALVQAMSSTTPLFVFGFGVALSLFWPKLGREDLSRGSLIRKGIAVALIVAGVALIGGPAH